MTKRSVVVELQARIGSYVANMGAAAKATDKVGDAADKAGSKQQQSAKQAAAAAAATAAALGKEATAAQNAAKAHDMHYNSAGKLVDANGKFVSSARAAEAGLDTYSKAVVDAGKASDTAAAAAARAGGPLKRLGATLDEVATSAKNNREAWDQAGTALTTFGAVSVGALGLAAKSAMDWESSWAGVTKTVDGTPEQMAELEQGIRGLAKSLPLAHGEIAAVAEAAGQLGVAREDVLGFTKTMIDLGESTNLTADEAATQIAQISNVMGTMADEGAEGVSRFGATLVALGNSGASTESEILAMSQRIAGAMATVGGSEVEVLALSNALASMGVKAELGGGVTTRVLLGMYSSIQDGGPKLEAFADTAGVTASAFAAAFEKSPVEALALVATGLNRVNEEGGSVTTALADMGIKGTEATSVMLALANSGTLLTDGLAEGNTAWQENTALLEEANKRYATTESQVKIAWNGIKDAAIDAGAVMLPVIQNIAEAVSDLANWFGELPSPVQGALSGLAGIAGVGSLVAGGLLLVVPRVLDTVNSFKTLATSAPRAADGLSKVGKAAGVAGAIAGVTFALAKIAEASYMDDIDTGMGNVALSLAKVAGEAPDASAALDGLFQDRDGGDLIGSVTDLESAIDRTFNKSGSEKFNDWAEGIVNGITGVEGSSQILEGTWDRIDTGLSDLVSSGSIDEAEKTFKGLSDQMIAQGATAEDVAAMFPQYADALAGAAAEQESAATGAEESAAAMEIQAAAAEEAAAASEEMQEALAEIGLSADGTIASLNTFIGVLQTSGLLTLSARDASRNFEAAIDSIQPAIDDLIAKHGGLGEVLNSTATDFDDNTEAGREAGAAFDAIASSGANMAQSMADAGGTQEELQAQLGTTYDSLITAAGQFGITGESADLLARDVMGIPSEANIDTWMSDEALARAEATTAAMDSIPGEVDVHSFMSGDANDMALTTKASAEDVPDDVTVQSWMSDAAFIEALETRAAALNIPPDVAVASFMSSAARNEADSTTAQVLNIPAGTSISSYMDAYARWEAQNLNAELDRANGRVVTSYMDVITRRKTVDLGSAPAGTNLPLGGIGMRASGGRLPTSGPGTEKTDGILGVLQSTGAPISWLDGGEQITSRAMTDKHSDLLWAIHRDDPRLSAIPALAGGGRISREYAPAPAYAGGGGGSSSLSIDYAQLADAMGSRPIQNNINIDGRQMFTWIQNAPAQYRAGRKG